MVGKPAHQLWEKGCGIQICMVGTYDQNDSGRHSKITEIKGI